MKTELIEQLRTHNYEGVESEPIPRFGTYWVVKLPTETMIEGVNAALKGSVISLNSRRFRVTAINTRLLECQLVGWPIGLFGEFVD